MTEFEKRIKAHHNEKMKYRDEASAVTEGLERLRDPFGTERPYRRRKLSYALISAAVVMVLVLTLSLALPLNSSLLSVDGSMSAKDVTFFEILFTPRLVYTEKADGTYSVKVNCELSAYYRYITIPSTHNGKPVTEIEEEGFDRCSALSEMIIPSSITRIGEGAFAFCVKLKNIKFNGTMEEWERIDIAKGVFEGVSATAVQCSDGTIYLK